ncbi:hypothetical protein MPH_09184 [Macrophomina phaseolina MS6]|uniref:Uncharacterized protein n=1 Tax=Macrophomina phaseolina (strain MS6) TaxID=1126212 RepID=K2RGI8_MACPH|nr:hypothetical protein MPH_09184 [Macrophomina phaseolina MS6]
MSNIVSILSVGLDFDWSLANLSHKFDVPKVRARVFKEFDELRSAPGVECEIYYVNSDKEGLFDDFAAKLREGHRGKPWKGVMIGWGVRGSSDMTSLFETLVNTIKDEIPQSRIIFSGPGSTQLESVERNFPHIKRSSESI